MQSNATNFLKPRIIDVQNLSPTHAKVNGREPFKLPATDFVEAKIVDKPIGETRERNSGYIGESSTLRERDGNYSGTGLGPRGSSTAGGQRTSPLTKRPTG